LLTAARATNNLSHLKQGPTVTDITLEKPEEQVHWLLTRRAKRRNRRVANSSLHSARLTAEVTYALDTPVELDREFEFIGPPRSRSAADRLGSTRETRPGRDSMPGRTSIACTARFPCSCSCSCSCCAAAAASYGRAIDPPVFQAGRCTRVAAVLLRELGTC